MSNSRLTETELHRVEDKEALIRAFPVLAEWLQRAIRYSGGRCTLQDMADPVLEWWIIGDTEIRAILVTEELVYPSGEAWLSISFAGGHGHRDWVHHIDDFRAIAAERGLMGVQCEVRKGFAPALKAAGMRETHRRLEIRA